MSIFSSSTSWTGNCSGTNQSPINLSHTSAKPCDLMCELVFDDAMVASANTIITDEGLILSSTSGLGSCKFNGEGYMCNSILVNHPSHHTIENIQADAEIVAFFTNPTGARLNVSALVRVNPAETTATHFFNSFIPYAGTGGWNTVNLGENWGIFMMVPPNGAYFYYDGSDIIPNCAPVKWCVFKSMINMDANNFALLTKNVAPGSRPIQPLGDREIFLNDIDQLPGGPMPHDGKTYMRCKRAPKKGDDVKPVKSAGVQDTKKAKTKGISDWAGDQISKNGIFALIDVVLLICAFVFGVYYAWLASKGPYGLYIPRLGQDLAIWVRGLFIKTPAPMTV